VVIYVPIILYNYTVITNHDPILHEYYNTKRRKIMIYREIYTVQKLEKAHEQQKGILRADQEGLEGKELRTVNVIPPCFCCNDRRGHHGPSPGIWTRRSRGCQKTTQPVCKMMPSGVHKKYTYVDKSESQKHISKTVS